MALVNLFVCFIGIYLQSVLCFLMSHCVTEQVELLRLFPLDKTPHKRKYLLMSV